ncbi:MAG: hypothetical protein HY874_02315, partial [Chloroflexi bacterium]|nr:hypothetical protein [Chloroflexota bacterium]
MSAPSSSHGPMIAFGVSIALAGAVLLATTLTGIAGAVSGHDPVAICHWVPAHGGSYMEITVDDDGSFQGHADHPNDIIPAPATGCPGGAQTTASPDVTRPAATRDPHSPTAIPTLAHTPTPAADTVTPQASLTSTPTLTATAAATGTPTPVPTTTDTPTATATAAETATSQSTATSVPTATDTATATATVMIQGSVTPLATSTNTPTATATPTGTVVTQGSVTPLPTNTRTRP